MVLRYEIVKMGIMYIPNKTITINNNVKLINTDKIFTWINKVTRVITGTTSIRKGTVDLVDAITY